MCLIICKYPAGRLPFDQGGCHLCLDLRTERVANIYTALRQERVRAANEPDTIYPRVCERRGVQPKLLLSNAELGIMLGSF